MPTPREVIAQSIAEASVRRMSFDGAAKHILCALEEAGYVMVPKEPTHEMLNAFWEAMFEERLCDQHVLIGAGYDAMLAASQKGGEE